MKSNRDVMLKYLFTLIISISEKTWVEISNEVLTKEVLYALCWHLPLAPWRKIHISDNSIHVEFTPSSSIVVKCDIAYMMVMSLLQLNCCPSFGRILVDNDVDRSDSYR